MPRGDRTMTLQKNHPLCVGLPVLLTLLALGCSPNAAVEPAPQSDKEFVAKQDLPSATKQLLEVGEAQSPGIGDTGMIGPYYKLKEVFVAHGNHQYFLKMLQSHEVLIRAMAMDCLLETEGKKAIHILYSKIWERSPLAYRGGCVGYYLTEGEYAWMRLCESGEISEDEAVPWVSPEDRQKMDLRILSRNDAAIRHKYKAESILELFEGPLQKEFFGLSGSGSGLFGTSADEAFGTAREPKPMRDKSKAIRLDWESLKGIRGDMSDAEVVKALGRIGQGESIKKFLIQCVRDVRLDPQARLAAASGLTRFADDKARETIESYRNELDHLENNGGSLIWKDYLGCEKYNIFKIPKAPSFSPLIPDEAKILEQNLPGIMKNCLHLAGLSKLFPSAFWLTEPYSIPEMAVFRAKTVLKLSEQLQTVSQPWNTYGGAAYCIEYYLACEDLVAKEKTSDENDQRWLRSHLIKNLLTEEEYQRLLRNISTAIQEDQKQQGHPGGK